MQKCSPVFLICLQAFSSSLVEKEGLLNECLQICGDILRQAHPDATNTLKRWQVTLRARWEDVVHWARQRESKIGDALDDLQANARLLDELLLWLTQMEQILTAEDQRQLPEDLAVLEQLFEDHQVCFLCQMLGLGNRLVAVKRT